MAVKFQGHSQLRAYLRSAQRFVIRFTIVSLGGAALMSCASGSCRSYHTIDGKTVDASAEKKSTGEFVKVFMPDGSKQCGMGEATPIEKMAKDLEPIAIKSQATETDGMMHVQACGTPTGRIHVFEIPAASLEDAVKRGFRPL